MSKGLIHTLFLSGLVLAIVIYDVAAISIWGKPWSISAWAIRTSYQYPSIVFIVGFGLGFTFGHLFWRMKKVDVYGKDKDVK